MSAPVVATVAHPRDVAALDWRPWDAPVARVRHVAPHAPVGPSRVEPEPGATCARHGCRSAPARYYVTTPEALRGHCHRCREVERLRLIADARRARGAR